MKPRRLKIRPLSILLLATILLYAVYVLSDLERIQLDDAARAGAPGEFVRLSDGVTHYEVSGPASGPVVVLVHGFSAPYFTWDRNVEALANAGFRVVRCDLFGRGLSDRPKLDYDVALFTRQIDELLDALSIDRPVNLVGLSMGGPVVAAYANLHPQRVASVALVNPQVVQITAETIFPVNVPGVGEYLYTVYIQPYILAKQADSFADPARLPAWQAMYAPQMQYKGFRRAMISTLRNFDLDPNHEYARLGEAGVPVLLVMGENDQTVPVESAQPLLEHMPQAQLHVLPQAGHVANDERADLFNPILLEFLNQLN